MKRIAILGAGGMGTALALLFGKTGAQVRLWSRSEAHATDLARRRVNDRHLPGIRIPEDTLVTACARETLDGAELIVAAVPSLFLRSTLTALADRVPAGIPFLSVVKGIENGTFARPSQIIVEIARQSARSLCSAGRAMPRRSLAVCRPRSSSPGRRWSSTRPYSENLNHEAFRVYTNPDAVGVELAGALKNILGIAAGICDGLGFGDNAKAALLTRGLVEISRLGVTLGRHQPRSMGWRE